MLFGITVSFSGDGRAARQGRPPISHRENCEEFDKSQSIPNLLVLIRTLTKNAGTV